jgi:hypothetical protein
MLGTIGVGKEQLSKKAYSICIIVFALTSKVGVEVAFVRRSLFLERCANEFRTHILDRAQNFHWDGIHWAEHHRTGSQTAQAKDR